MSENEDHYEIIDNTGQSYPAYICENTHEQNDVNNKYCPTCGEKVLSCCPSCSSIIKRGHIESEPMFLNPYDPEELTCFEDHKMPFDNFEIPNYCSECGKPYPWTEKFFKDYKTILELQSEEIDKELQDKIFKATEEALKNKFKGPSLTILRLTLGRVSSTAKPFLMDVLSGVTVSKIIDILK